MILRSLIIVATLYLKSRSVLLCFVLQLQWFPPWASLSTRLHYLFFSDRASHFPECFSTLLSLLLSRDFSCVNNTVAPVPISARFTIEIHFSILAALSYSHQTLCICDSCAFFESYLQFDLWQQQSEKKRPTKETYSKKKTLPVKILSLPVGSPKAVLKPSPIRSLATTIWRK